MRPPRSRRVQAQRKFAQGAYVPPNAVPVVAAENRRDAAQDTRNITMNHMTATSLLDVVSLQSAASTPERLGLHYHLTSQPVVLLERLRSRNPARDVLPSPQTETSPPQHPKSTIKKTAEPPKFHVYPKDKDCKRVHAMSLRSRRLSKLEMNKVIAQSCVPIRKSSAKRKVISSDEDEPLIFQKHRKKSPAAAAASEISSWEKSLKVKSSKDIDVPRKITAKEIKTSLVSSNQIKEGAKKKKSALQKRIPKERSPKKPAVTAIKEDLTSARDKLVNGAALDNLVTLNDSIVAVNPVDSVVVRDHPLVVPVGPVAVSAVPAVVPDDPVVVPVNPVVVPDAPAVLPDAPVLVPDAPLVVPDAPVVVPDAPVVVPDALIVDPDVPVVGPGAPAVVPDARVPDAPVVGPDASVVGLDAPVVSPVAPVVGPDAPVVGPDAPVVGPDASVVGPDAPVVNPDAPVVGPFAPEVGPDASVLGPDAPVVNPDAPVVDPDAPVVGPNAPVVNPDAPVVGPDAPVVGPDAQVVGPDVPVVGPDAPVVASDHPDASGAPFFQYGSDEENETAEEHAAYLARLDKALVCLDDLPDLDNLSDDDDEPTVRKEVHYEVPLNQKDIADQDQPTSSSNASLRWESSDDEPMVRAEAAVKQVHRRTNDSPVPGPSGMQLQSRKNTDQENNGDSRKEISSFIQKMLGKRTVNVEIKRRAPTLPKTCVAAAWRTEQDVVNASTEQLDSRCKICKPCYRFEKVINASTLFKTKIVSGNSIDQDSTREASENELGRENGETESGMVNEDRTVAGEKDEASENELGRENGETESGMVNEDRTVAGEKDEASENELGRENGETESGMVNEDRTVAGEKDEASENELGRENGETETGMVNEDRTVAGEKDDSYLHFEVEGDPNVKLKVGVPVLYGKSMLRINWNQHGESSKDQQNLCQLDGKEHVLDKVIDTLNIIDNVNSKGPNVNSEIQNNNPVDRRVSISSDSTGMSSDSNTEQEKTHRVRSENKKLKYQKVVATRRQLAEAKVKRDSIKPDDTRSVEKRDEISLVEHNKHCEEKISRLNERFEEMQKQKEKEIARLKVVIRDKVRAEMEADLRMMHEVDSLAQTLAHEKDAKTMLPKQIPDPDEPGTSGGTLVDAPVYYPSREEFQDPISFYEKIYPEAMKYGVCKVVPPPDWMPPSEVHGDIRFDVMNQYISRLFSRWGPAARELSAIKLCLYEQANINSLRPPHVDGVEINLPKLYHLVQRLGGLETVINKKRWGKVADDLKITKTGSYDKKLDQIYVKYLLPYDTLSHQERQEIMQKVEFSWNRKNQKLLDRAMNPLYRQQRLLSSTDSSDEETDTVTKIALRQAEDCIIKGRVMQHSRFKKVASLAYENTFGQGSEAAPPALAHIEELYWRFVTSGTDHVCVHTAAIDTGLVGHGFTTTVEPYASHPWNPKQVINNPRNVLRYLGPVVGVTLPTLLLGMLFSTSCWHKDPHGVAWYEYQSKGPTRIWYGIPADQADNFRKAVETLCPTSCQNKALWLSSEIAMIPPSILHEYNVRLTRVTQCEGEFIMAFPNAYTSCISTGYTESESVYFASSGWIDFMWNAFKIARESCEPTMFSMEQLLYKIGLDKEAEQDLLKRALPLYDRMLREEVTNRQMLQEKGLPCVQELLSAQGGQRPNTHSERPLDECEYCRTSLFLSKVKGLPEHNSVLCLEHTLMLLDEEKFASKDVRQLQLVVQVSVRELNKVHDDMRRRMRPLVAR